MFNILTNIILITLIFKINYTMMEIKIYIHIL